MAEGAVALRFDSTRPWRAQPRRLRWGVVAALMGLLLLVLAGQWGWQTRSLAAARGQLAALEAQQAQATGQTAGPAAAGAQPATPGIANATPRVDPAQWPLASEALDAWVREAVQAAAAHNGVSLQRLSVTPSQPAGAGEAAGPAPYAHLNVAARGSYAALKAWQAEMQALMPSLGVESLRLQAPPNDGTGQLSADWVWRLWVRPGDARWDARWLNQAALAVGWRPPLNPAARDPFGGLAPVAPPAPAVLVEAAPLAAPAPPIEALAPPLQWTTLGRLQGPDGRHRISGHWGHEGETVLLAEGSLSPAGHRVLRITARQLELQHPDTQERLSFPLPAPPRFETR